MIHDFAGKETLNKIADNLKPYIHRTPVLSSEQINKIADAHIFFKCEMFQKTGSFKVRGAMNAVLQLSDEQKEKGIITHSSGNFAQALAYTANKTGIKATIIMPHGVVASKRDAVLGYGAEIIYSGNQPLDRENKCEEIKNNTGAVFIHPSNDINVIHGHSSCAIELINDSEKLDAVIAPVGGGGLISGIALGFKNFSKDTAIFAGEPANADDAFRSFKSGKIIPVNNPNTIADGLKTSLGNVTFPIIKEMVTEIFTVTEEEIIFAMKIIWERLKIITEPSGAVAFAALIKNKELFKGKNIAVILSGGNVDLNKLPF
ncbi:MAG: threonine/serine dehydratase [Ignavibacteria bacterium]|nr:threonine/serine dehydratase [Ignavibacteria bacterium]